MSKPDPSQVITDLLDRWRGGDAAASQELMAGVYTELRAIAARRLPQHGAAATLSTTELVHETFLRLQAQQRVRWRNRSHFFAIVARLTRRVLVDHMRQRLALKRDMGERRVPLSRVDPAVERSPESWIELDRALRALAAVDKEAEQVVTYRFFAGMSVDEVASLMASSPSTVARRWRFARAFLEGQLQSRG